MLDAHQGAQPGHMRPGELIDQGAELVQPRRIEAPGDAEEGVASDVLHVGDPGLLAVGLAGEQVPRHRVVERRAERRRLTGPQLPLRAGQEVLDRRPAQDRLGRPDHAQRLDATLRPGGHDTASSAVAGDVRASPAIRDRIQRA